RPSRPRRRTSSSRCRARCGPSAPPSRARAAGACPAHAGRPVGSHPCRLRHCAPSFPNAGTDYGIDATTPPRGHQMAVYTDVSAEELAEFLGSYDIGELLSYKGIAEGVENSNFLLHTSKGAFFLTLY